MTDPINRTVTGDARAADVPLMENTSPRPKRSELITTALMLAVGCALILAAAVWVLATIHQLDQESHMTPRQRSNAQAIEQLCKSAADMGQPCRK